PSGSSPPFVTRGADRMAPPWARMPPAIPGRVVPRRLDRVAVPPWRFRIFRVDRHRHLGNSLHPARRNAVISPICHVILLLLVLLPQENVLTSLSSQLYRSCARLRWRLEASMSTDSVNRARSVRFAMAWLVGLIGLLGATGP